MALASPALLPYLFSTHSLRCGLEECRQLRWLSKNHTVRGLEQNQKRCSLPHRPGRLCSIKAVQRLFADIAPWLSRILVVTFRYNTLHHESILSFEPL